MKKFTGIIFSFLLIGTILFPVAYISIHELFHHHEYFHCEATGNERHYHEATDECSFCEYLATFHVDDFVEFTLLQEIKVTAFIIEKYYPYYSSYFLISNYLRAPPVL